MPHRNDLLTTTAVGLILGKSTKAVGDWCNASVLECRRTPGGPRRLLLGDVMDFAQQRGLPVNLRKLKKVNKKVRPLA